MAHPARQNLIQPFRGAQIEKFHPFSRGSVGKWLFYEGTGPKVFDLSGNNNHGTLTNMDPATDWVPGRERGGWALDFDGTDDYVNLGDPSIVDFGAGDFAILAWISLDSPTGSRQMIVAKDDDASGQRQFSLEYNQTDDSSRPIGLSYYKATDSQVVLRTGANPITDSEWHFIVAQRNGNSFDIYIDGLLSISGTTAGTHGTMQSTTTELRIGNRSFSGFTDEFNGRIDDVSILNRALTADEAKSRFIYPYAMVR